MCAAGVLQACCTPLLQHKNPETTGQRYMCCSAAINYEILRLYVRAHARVSVLLGGLLPPYWALSSARYAALQHQAGGTVIKGLPLGFNNLIAFDTETSCYASRMSNPTHFKKGHVPWNTRTTPGCGKPGHNTDYINPSSNKKNCHECLKEAQRKRAAKRQRDRRRRVIDHYGGKCECCGEVHLAMLALDHINGGGNKHRREIQASGSVTLYRWIIEQGFPRGFRVLCFNCNQAIHVLGNCPHRGGDAI